MQGTSELNVCSQSLRKYTHQLMKIKLTCGYVLISALNICKTHYVLECNINVICYKSLRIEMTEIGSLLKDYKYTVLK